MENAEIQRTDLSGSESGSVVRWRPWPCEGCGGSSSALGFLGRSIGADAEIEGRDRNDQIELRKKRQAGRLMEWVNSCSHTEWFEMCLPRLDQGSEHLVLSACTCGPRLSSHDG